MCTTHQCQTIKSSSSNTLLFNELLISVLGSTSVKCYINKWVCIPVLYINNLGGGHLKKKKKKKKKEKVQVSYILLVLKTEEKN